MTAATQEVLRSELCHNG